MMGKILIFIIVALLSATVAKAQTEQQKQGFITACATGAIKTGCPPQNTSASDINEHPTISIEQIRAKNAAAQLQADNDAAQARAVLQSPSQSPMVAAAPTPIAPVASPKPPVAKHVFITPIGRHSAAACGPATPPPGAGALYGINRARCLRTSR
jgi:hypothetical protein